MAAARAVEEDQLAAVDLQRDAMPSFGEDDGPAGDMDGNEWQTAMSLEGQVSAAGPAVAAVDVTVGAVPSASAFASTGVGVAVEPEYWFNRNVATLRRAREWEAWWEKWKGSAVDDDEVVEGDLDAHQKFLLDVMDCKADEWDECCRQGRPSAYKPARVICAGTAGAGKTHTIRSLIKLRRRRAQNAGKSGEQVRGCCSLAAPTGSASFQMKFGAATAHRTYGISPMRPFARLAEQGDAYNRLRQKLKLARLMILDERSMIGRMFLGKIAFRLQEVLGRGGGPQGASLGFRDFLLVGDDKQIEPIGDQPVFVEGAYKGKAKKAEDGPEPAALVGQGLSVRNECEDVVILRGMHRRDDGEHIKDATKREAYRNEADEFVRVCRRMADCEWTRAEHAWLSRRNKSVLCSTEAGLREYESFKDAILLTDNRKRNAEGRDGADQINACELRRVAQERKVPIVSWTAKHDDYEKGTDPTVISPDEFSGLSGSLEMCEAARVLLTSNMWPEAGLVNGAMGNVRGFVWPEGGHPGAEQKELAMPLYIVVEFDDVKLKDVHGELRSFFPGEPDKKNWVPVPVQVVSSNFEEKLKRKQFPLVLAWAITHWKAQGMTLPRARVRLSAKVAGQQHGVGFVACTRVRHPTHMVFEEDLPEWEAFQAVRDTPTFHRRRRFELRLQAQASKTIRKYRFFEDDKWSRDDAARADALLKKLESERESQRSRVRSTGRRAYRPGGKPDDDAYLWEGEPDYAAHLDDAAKDLGGICDDVVSEIAAYRRIKDRLLCDLHMPAVKEALGALIPEWLHPSQDDPKRRGKKKGFGEKRVGVNITADGWRVSVFVEQELREHKPVAKDTMEFFLMLARLVTAKLRLPLAVGSHKLGGRLLESVANKEPLGRLSDELKDWRSSWRSEAMAAERMLLPVPLYDQAGCREWYLVSLSSAVQGETLGCASRWQVEIAERGGRTKGFPALVARRLAELVRGQAISEQGCVDVARQSFPAHAGALDTTLAILGLVFKQVARSAGVPHLDPESDLYLGDWRDALTEAFALLRRQADARGEIAVENSFARREQCLSFLDVLSRRPANASAEEESRLRPLQMGVGVSEAAKELRRFLKLVTWNIAGGDLSDAAPTSWRLPDKLCAMRRELLRLKPDVLALQECPGDGVSDAVPAGMRLLGSVECHAAGCYTQLYCRSDLDMVPVVLRDDSPAVAASCKLDGKEGMFVSAHLCPFPENAAERAKEVKQILGSRAGRAVVLMGDMNVRREEVNPLCEEHGLRAMPCSTATWNGRVNKFYPDQKHRRDTQMFDQIWTSGSVWVEGHMVCACKEYRAGRKFFLSDHFALLGLMDVHTSYGAAGGGMSSVAEKRREILGGLRTESAGSERFMTEEKERSGEKALALEADREDQRQQAKKMKAAAKARKEKEEKLRRDREVVFGASSIFAMHSDVCPPSAASEFDLEAFRGLLATQAPEIWREHVPGGRHPLTGLRVPHLCSYVPASLQLLLRIPAVSMWLAKHMDHCGLGDSEAERSGRCVTCALWASRDNLRHRVRHSGWTSFPPLFVHQGLLGKAFSSGGDVVFADYLVALLQEMRRLEIASSRAMAWPGMAGEVAESCTHVDRLFSYVCEERCYCTACGAVEVKFTRAALLSLPVPASSGTTACVTELYTEHCRLVPDDASEDGHRFCHGACGSRQEHWVQRRMASSPNVLIVKVPRFSEEGDVRTFRLEAEQELFLPGLEPFEMFGAVYSKGRRSGETGSAYICVCRGPDYQFW